MARPLKALKLDEEQIRRLAALGCTNEDIAAVAGVSVDTLTRRFAETLKEGKAELHNKLRAAQVERALNGSDALLIWLGKTVLRQVEAKEAAAEPTKITVEHVYGTPPKDEE